MSRFPILRLREFGRNACFVKTSEMEFDYAQLQEASHQVFVWPCSVPAKHSQHKGRWSMEDLHGSVTSFAAS